MTPEETTTLARAVAAEMRGPARPVTAAAPKNGNGRLLAWVAGVAGVLAAAAALAAVDTWRGLAVVESRQEAVDAAIVTIQGDTAYLRTNVDQLLGRLGVTPVKP
jgi:hypothetical protein